MDDKGLPTNLGADDTQSFRCPICSVSFDAPGFDAAQIAATLARHMQANHQDATTARENASTDPTAGATAGEPVDDERDPSTVGDDTAPDDAPTGPGAPLPPHALPVGDSGAARSPAPFAAPGATPRSDAPTTAPSVGKAGAARAGGPTARRCPRCGAERGDAVICPSCASTQPVEPRAAETDESQRTASRPTSPLLNRGKPRTDGTKREPPDARAAAQKLLGGARSAKKAAGGPGAGAGRTGAGARVNDAVDKGIQGAAASVGIPPAVAKVAIVLVRKVLPYAVAATLVVVASLFGGVLGDDAPEDRVWNVSLSEQTGIPENYIDAYQEAARRHKVPWTVLAAIGAQASYHGRVNPYLQTVPSPAGRNTTALSDVILVGDSLGQGVDPYLGPLVRQLGSSYQSVVESGTRTAWGTEQLAALAPSPQATIVVGLGTNDSGGAPQFARDVDALMNTVSLSNTVWWLTIDKDGAGPYNQVLREKQQRWPNMRVADWKTHVDDRGITTVDGLHYDAAGYQERARFILGNVTGNVIVGGLRADGELSGPGVLPVVDGSCPSLPSPIAGETRSQGAGPLMLVPAVLEASGKTLGDDVQNICASADALAELLAQTATLAAGDAGSSFPRGIASLAQTATNGDATAAEEVHRFWADVVDRSGALGTTSEVTCTVKEQGSLEDQDYIGDAIDSYWRCVLNNASLVSVRSVDVGAVVSYDVLTAVEATARGVEEALAVAWTWSQWGTADCDATAAVAGVFPLDEETFTTHAGDLVAKGRCDKQASIVAAANAFIAGEKTQPGARPGTWRATIGGWGNLAHVAGPGPSSDFDRDGPWQPLSPGLACSQVLANALVQRAGTGRALAGVNAATVQGYIANGLPTEREGEVDALLGEILAIAQSDALCATTRAYQASEWFGAIAGAYNGDALSGVGAGASKPRLTAGDLSVAAGVGDIAAAIANHAQTRATVSIRVAAAGTTPLLARLSHERLALPARPAVVRETSGGTLSLGSQVVNIAVGYYGGIFVGSEGLTIGGIGLLGAGVPYAEVFNAVGQEYGIDPRLLAAVAKQESNFNADAGCPSTGPAYGMMQKEPDMVPTVCGDPKRQVSIAAQMLLDRFGEAGDWRGALWGYNNGGVFSRKWRELDADLERAEDFAVEFYCNGASSCTRAEIAMKYVSDDPTVRSTYVSWLDYQRLFPSAVISTAQLMVSGNDCPNTATSQIAGRELLRDGSSTIGMRALCAASVAAAPTPEAARAIIFAFKNLGVIYDQTLRNGRSFDCSSYVSRAYASAGVSMSSGNNYYSTHTLLSHSGYSRPDWIVPVPVYEARPGDLIFPYEGHVAMLLANGYMIHTDSTGDVSKVERAYVSSLQINRVVPAIAPRVAPTS